MRDVGKQKTTTSCTSAFKRIAKEGISLKNHSKFYEIQRTFSFYRFFPQHFLYFKPLPQLHGSFLPCFE